MTTFLIILISIFAFSCAFMYILSVDRFSPAVVPLNSTLGDFDGDGDRDDYNHFKVKFKEMIMTLFWAILNPGPSDVFDPETLEGQLAYVLFAVYQIGAVIIFLK